MNLATIALRAVVDAIAQDEDASRAALVALLAHRDPKPAKTERPAARRRVARPARPAPAAPAAEPEGTRLVAALEQRYGTLDAVAERFGFNRELLRRWSKGAPCSPSSLARLRTAVAASRAPTKQDEASDPGQVAAV